MGPGFVCVGKGAMPGSLPHDGSKFMLLASGSAGGECRYGSSSPWPGGKYFLCPRREWRFPRLWKRLTFISIGYKNENCFLKRIQFAISHCKISKGVIALFEKQFVKRLAELRMKKGVSARDMSLSIGQSAGYINNIENGKNLPSMMSFFYICEYLGITPEEFFDFKSCNPGRLSEIAGEMKSLNDEQLTVLSDMIRSWKK